MMAEERQPKAPSINLSPGHCPLQKNIPVSTLLTGNESNPDTNGNLVTVQVKASFQSQLDPDPDHHFPGVDLQIYGGAPIYRVLLEFPASTSVDPH
jgi:hypothetical protein